MYVCMYICMYALYIYIYNVHLHLHPKFFWAPSRLNFIIRSQAAVKTSMWAWSFRFKGLGVDGLGVFGFEVKGFEVWGLRV